MKDQFVTYEIAKRLKELGFNEPCLTAYTPEDGLLDVFDQEDPGIMSNSELREGVIAAPLWQQAIDWLRMRGMHCLPYPLWFSFGAELNYSYEIVHEGEQLFKGSIFKTPEEARQAAIEKALTLIS